ncbi:hypothetical protein [Sneathiella sp.]|uniref:FliH/SctL family protein n=1 Tax=Sneathiella sp. TaxID=1964365 RepID=UPI003561457C
MTNKFMFDTEFCPDGTSAHDGARQAKAEVAIYTESNMAELKIQAFDDGVRMGESQTQETIENGVSLTLAAISTQLQELMGTHDAKMLAVKRDAAQLALTIAKKLASSLIQQHPEEEVLKLFEECLSDLRDEPRIVVRASDDICEKLAGKVDEISIASGFQGNVILLPDQTKKTGDCRVEWADGGVERNLEDLQQKMSGIVSRFAQSIRSPGNEPGNQNDSVPHTHESKE